MAVGSIGIDEPASIDKYLHTNQRTISSTAREDQYVLPGWCAYPTYVVTSSNVSVAVANDHLLQIMGDGTNYTRLIGYRVSLSHDLPAAATLTRLQLLRITTAGTGGTSVTPAPYDTADTYGGGAMTLPTAKGTESTVLHRFAVFMESASDDEFSRVYEWRMNPYGKPIIFGTGTGAGLAWKVIDAVASAQLYVEAEIVVSSYL